MTATMHRPDQPPTAPHGLAISGILFSALYVCCLAMIRLAIPADATETGAWLADPTKRAWTGIAMNLVPFAGIAFLWFMAVLRERVGLLEDRLLSTVFLGSGLLFVAMLFATAAVAQGTLLVFGGNDTNAGQSETFRVARGTTHALMMTFSTKMSAVFIFVTSTIGLRTDVFPRWICYTGYALGLALLVVITTWAWIALLFPCWVLLVSAWILIVESHEAKLLNARFNEKLVNG